MDERITKYFGGELSEAERIGLLKERETDPKLKEDFATIQNLRAITYLSADCADSTEGEKKYTAIKKKTTRKNIRLISRRIAGYAAAMAVTFMITWMITDRPESLPQIAGIEQELYVPAGQRARITLPDGSSAWLNAGSRLYYPSVFGKERKVRLEGEGFFEVAKDADKPFIVAAADIEIKALGTQFNVYNYAKADFVSATLTEGSIVVYPAGKENEGQLLSPNQRLIVENGKFTLEKVMDADELLWKEGIYSFRKERMQDIIKKLELYFDVEIVVNNPRILEYEYTGKFRQRDGILEILRIIQKIHHFKIDNDKDISLITLS